MKCSGKLSADQREQVIAWPGTAVADERDIMSLGDIMRPMDFRVARQREPDGRIDPRGPEPLGPVPLGGEDHVAGLRPHQACGGNRGGYRSPSRPAAADGRANGNRYRRRC